MSLASQVFNYLWPGSSSSSAHPLGWPDRHGVESLLVPHVGPKQDVDQMAPAQDMMDGEIRSPYIHVSNFHPMIVLNESCLQRVYNGKLTRVCTVSSACLRVEWAARRAICLCIRWTRSRHDNKAIRISHQSTRPCPLPMRPSSSRKECVEVSMEVSIRPCWGHFPAPSSSLARTNGPSGT